MTREIGMDGTVDVLGENVPWMNLSGEDIGVARTALDQVGRELALWVGRSRNAAGQRPSIFDRSAYAAPDNPYSQMMVARQATTNDDVVSGVADVTEALAFQGIKWESENPDDADIFNQISRDLDLDSLMRAWHREDYTYSQAVLAMWWDRRTYKVRGYNMVEEPPEAKTDPETGETYYTPVIDPTTGKPKKPRKVKRRKTYDIEVPIAITFLDPMKVVPVGVDFFGRDRLAWHASKDEVEAWEYLNSGIIVDPIMERLFLGKVTGLDRDTRDDLVKMGFDPNRLMWLNPDTVFRFTRTKPHYQAFADLRLKSVFPLLDLKQQLIEADRVTLIGAANYILLVKKGTKDDPAEQSEIDNLNENFKVVAKVPVIVSDHRLEIDIITPKQDFVLDPAKYDTLDRRILNRCLGSLTISSAGQRNESTLTVARGIARLLENRRHMMKRSLEKHLARAVVDRNPDTFEDEPNLTFVPRNVQLDADSQVVQAVMALRTQKELSRDSILEYFGFDQAVEAQRREYEEESGLDAIFGTTVPFNSPDNQGPNGAPVAPQVSGAQGGRPSGGGKTPQSPQRQTKPRAASGNVSTGGSDG